MNDLFDHRLRNAVRSLPAPDAPPGLIDRIIAERLAGERIDLPSATPRRRRPGKRFALWAIAAACVVTAIGIDSVIRARSPARVVSDTTGVFGSTGFFVAPAFAQTPPRGSGAPPISAFNPAAIDGKDLEYRTQFVDSAGRITPDGAGTIAVARAQYGGVSAFQISHTSRLVEDGQQRTLSETLFVDARTLRLLSRSVKEAPYRRFSQISIRQHFVGDSVTGEMTTDDNIRRPIAHRLAPAFAPYISDATAPLALAGVPLSSTWRGSVSVVGWAVRPNDVFYPVTLWVVGEDTLPTPRGPVPCWKLRVSASPEQRIEWVRKSDGIAIKSRDDGPPSPRGRREFVLLNP